MKAVSLWVPKRVPGETELLQRFELAVCKRRREIERAENGDAADAEPPQAQRPPTSTAIADDEAALFALYRNDYDEQRTLVALDEAKGKLPTANGTRLTASSAEWRPMSNDEVEAFEAAFRKHGKNFFLMRQEDNVRASMRLLLQSHSLLLCFFSSSIGPSAS